MTTSATAGHAAGAETLVPALADDGVADAMIEVKEVCHDNDFTEAFTVLRGQQLTGDLSFAHATNVLLEDMPPAWTEPEKRAFLRLSLQDASKYTPALYE
jgi:hypothetical protein